ENRGFIYPCPVLPVLPLVHCASLQWRRKTRERIRSQPSARHSMPARRHAPGSRTTGHVMSPPRRAHYRHQYGCRLIKTSTTEQALLTNHKPEPQLKRLPSESTTLATPFIIYCSSFVPVSGWLLIFLACHWNTERQRIG
uniref:Secreted protein n=1 Tax=Mesocestoides corti TaxID=53468 RepID=A0A5K3F156_MESCO